jgi:hypothetical protein
MMNYLKGRSRRKSQVIRIFILLNVNNILFPGLSAVKEIRISSNTTGKIEVFYKFDSGKPGWYPKPVDQRDIDKWNIVFRHNDPRQGNVISVDETPSSEKGRRQKWLYKVEYAGGNVETIELNCISIPVSFDYGEMTLQQHISTAENQRFCGSLLKPEYKETLLNNISKILKNRDCEPYIVIWEEYITSLPDSPDFALGVRYTNVLEQLISLYGGNVQVIFFSYSRFRRKAYI